MQALETVVNGIENMGGRQDQTQVFFLELSRSNIDIKNGCLKVVVIILLPSQYLQVQWP